MDAYKGVYKLSVHRFRELQPLLDELRREGFVEHKSPRFKVFLKHPDRDDWAVVVKAARSNDKEYAQGGAFRSGQVRLR